MALMKNNRKKIVSYLDKELRISEIDDLSCNGLQVEGRENIKRIALAVDACITVFEKTKKKRCQMIIAHHGLIWGGIKSVSKTIKQSLSFLLTNEINLYAAHIPLDLHPKLGNNIQLCKTINLKKIKEFGAYEGNLIGFEGELIKTFSIEELSKRINQKIGGVSKILPFGKEKIKRIGIISGGGAKSLLEAIEKDLDCFITGEHAHENYHLARESRMNVIYIGHYYSEKLGVIALGKDLEKRFGIKTTFIDEPTPI
jgi:dinuclear metal center YbgI/SA1388 family protein